MAIATYYGGMVGYGLEILTADDEGITATSYPDEKNHRLKWRWTSAGEPYVIWNGRRVHAWEMIRTDL